MIFKATASNVILKVKKKIKSKEDLLVETGEQDTILIGQIIAHGPECKTIFKDVDDACAYVNRVALLPWETETDMFYAVKEENIYGILVVE